MYVSSSVLDNAPKYLVGCIIQKRYLPAQPLQYPAHDPLQQWHPLHPPPSAGAAFKTANPCGIGSVFTTEMVTTSRRAQICS